MLGRRRRRWTNIKTALGQYLVFAGNWLYNRTKNTFWYEIKAGITPGWRLFGDIGECQIYEILLIFSKYSPNFPKRSHLSPNVLSVRRTFSKLFEMFPAIIRALWHLTPNPPPPPPKLLFSANIHQIVAECLSGSPFVHQFADCSPRSTISRQMFAKRSQNRSLFRRQMIAELVSLHDANSWRLIIDNLVKKTCGEIASCSHVMLISSSSEQFVVANYSPVSPTLPSQVRPSDYQSDLDNRCVWGLYEMEGMRASWIFIMTSPVYWLWYGGHTQVRLSGLQDLGREEGGSILIAHIRDIKESAGSRKLDRWRWLCQLIVVWCDPCLHASANMLIWRCWYWWKLTS